MQRTFSMKRKLPISYKNTEVKYWTESWKNVESFDILSAKQVYNLYYNTYVELSNYRFAYTYDIKKFINQWNHLEKGGVVDIAKRHMRDFPDDKFVYLEIPYQFYLDNMTDWLEDEFDIPLETIKQHIKNGESWEYKNTPQAFSYLNYVTFKKYGVANPIFNNGKHYPKRSTHITAFTSQIKSDVPILLQIDDDLKFKTEEHTEELPYFQKSYLTMEVDINNKSVDFFLDKTKHIGVYKK